MTFVQSSPVRNHIIKSDALGIALIKREEFWLGFISILVKPNSITFPYRGRQSFLPCISSQLKRYLLE